MSNPIDLVVFDMPYRKIVQHLLTTQDAGDVRAFKTPEEAESALDPTVALLVVDFDFPDENGNPSFGETARLCREARKMQPDLPILILTSSPIEDVSISTICRDYAFPVDPNVRFFDVVTQSPKELVGVIRDWMNSRIAVA